MVSPGKGSPGVCEKEPTSQTKPEALGKVWEAMAMSESGRTILGISWLIKQKEWGAVKPVWLLARLSQGAKPGACSRVLTLIFGTHGNFHIVIL